MQKLPEVRFVAPGLIRETVEIEAYIEPFHGDIRRVSFFISEGLLKLIQEVAGGDAFLCHSHQNVVFEHLLAMGTQAKKDELDAQAGQDETSK